MAIAYVYIPIEPGDAIPGVPARDLHDYEVAALPPSLKRQVTRPSFGIQRIYVPIDQITETEQERLDRLAAEAAQRAAEERLRQPIYGYQFYPWADNAPTADELVQMQADVAAVADVPAQVDALETTVAAKADASAVTALAARTPPATTTDQAFVLYDSVAGGLGWFQGPVLVSGWAPYKLESDTGVPMASQVQAFLAAIAGTGIPGVLLPGTYIAEDSLRPASATKLYLYGATIQSQVPASDGKLVRFEGVSDVHLIGGTFDGNKPFYVGTTEHRHNIALYGASNITLEGTRSTNAKGDGLYVAPATPNTDSPCRNVRLLGITVDANHRNNLSIISVDGLYSAGSRYLNASGTNPQAGVDIEPNFTTETVRNLRFVGDSFEGNTGGGFTVSFRVDASGNTSHGGVKVLGGHSRANGTVGASTYNAKDVEFIGFDLLDNVQDGLGLVNGPQENITVRGGTIARNGRYGVYGYVSNESTHGLGWIRNLRLIDLDIFDNGASAAGTYDGIYLTAVAASGDVDGVMIRGVRSGNDLTTNQRRGLTTAAKVKNLTIRDSDLTGNASTAALLDDSNNDTRVIENVRGLSTTTNFAGAGTVTSIARTVLVAPTAPFTLTLPANPETREYEFFNTNGQAGTHNVTIVANTGHTIRNNGGTAVINSNYGHLVMRYRSSNWYVVSKTT